MDVMELTIHEYKPEYQPWFEKFNRDWIEKYFWMEPIDTAVLQHPDEHIGVDDYHSLRSSRFSRMYVSTSP